MRLRERWGQQRRFSAMVKQRAALILCLSMVCDTIWRDNSQAASQKSQLSLQLPHLPLTNCPDCHDWRTLYGTHQTAVVTGERANGMLRARHRCVATVVFPTMISLPEKMNFTCVCGEILPLRGGLDRLPLDESDWDDLDDSIYASSDTKSGTMPVRKDIEAEIESAEKLFQVRLHQLARLGIAACHSCNSPMSASLLMVPVPASGFQVAKAC